MKKYLFLIIYSILLAGFTTWLLLQVFVFSEVHYDLQQGVSVARFTPTPKGSELTHSGEATESDGQASNINQESNGDISDGKVPGDNKQGSDDYSKNQQDEVVDIVLAPTATPSPTLTPTPTPTNTPTPTPSPTPAWIAVPEGGVVDFEYEDENIHVRVIKYRKYNSNIYLTDIVLSSPEYLKTSISSSTKDPAEYAKEVNAIVSINGDYYTSNPGYVIRGGVIYRSTPGEWDEGRLRDDLVIMKDGSFMIANEGEYTAEQLQEMGAWDLLSFGPALIKDGEVCYDVATYKGLNRSETKTVNPRSAIGLIEENHYFFMTVDGRSAENEDGSTNVGITGTQMIEIAQGIGAKFFYNLDGGQSASIVYDGKVQNLPWRGKYAIRKVPDIIYVGY